MNKDLASNTNEKEIYFNNMERSTKNTENVNSLILSEGNCVCKIMKCRIDNTINVIVKHKDEDLLLAPAVTVYGNQYLLNFNMVSVVDSDVDTFLNNVTELREFIEKVKKIRKEESL